MKRNLLCMIFMLVVTIVKGTATDVTVLFYDAELPVLVNKQENIVCEILINSKFGGEIVNEVFLTQEGILPGDGIGCSLFFSGTSSVLTSRTPSQAIHEGVRNTGGSQSFYCHPAYSIRKSALDGIPDRIFFPVNTRLVKGDNYFWISFKLNPSASLDTRFAVALEAVKINGENIRVRNVKERNIIHRTGYALRQLDDDNVDSYRIPGLVTTNKGTLIAVYDARHQTNIDLQEDIDIGMSRSTDGGKSWEPMKIIMDMGEYNGLPQSQNGIGDPAVLVDERTNTIWASAVWVHGLANARAWRSVRPGMKPEDGTGQIMLANSTDDGLTWSDPINITSMVKTRDMTMLLQGPGRGITMRDGTLVFPVQYKSVENDLRGEISVIYSKDHGLTWHRANPVPTDGGISEPQIAEIDSGILMINARSSAPYRFIATTSDLGESWRIHESSDKILVEPGCMGSLLHIRKEDNVLKKDILLFSNPDFKASRPAMSSRRNITVKASLDGGETWPTEYQINLDEEQGWGYSCLTRIDSETIGILYEGSTAQMVFQRIKLDDLMKK